MFLKIVLSKQMLMEHLPLIWVGNTLLTHSVDDFKPELLQSYVSPLNVGDNPVVEEDTEGAVSEEMRDLPNLIKKNVAHPLLKLESIFNVKKGVLMS